MIKLLYKRNIFLYFKFDLFGTYKKNIYICKLKIVSNITT